VDRRGNGHTVAATLEEALRILRCDALTAYYRLVREMNGLSVTFDVEGELFSLHCADAELHLQPLPADATAFVRATRTTILELIDGKADMMDCVIMGKLNVWGDVRLLPNISRACIAFADGAIRSRRMRTLLTSFRRDTAPKEAGQSCNQSFLQETADRDLAPST
jgi:hypothetical protein